MKKLLGGLFALAMAISMNIASADAATLTNGSLTIDIREDNGAIDSIVFGGSDFYNPGTPVSDFGLQINGDTSTFVINDTDGSTSIPVTILSSASAVSVSGSINGIDFVRTYSLVEGLNVLRTSTELTNTTGSDLTLGYFDTFDPDQGVDQGTEFETYNDVLTLLTESGLATVGKSYEENGLTVVMGSVDSRTTVAAGGPFQIFDGNDLNTFFASPVDGEGSYDDEGLHVGINTLLAAGSSTSFVFDQAYALDPELAELDFITANRTPTPAPEPSTMILGLMGIGAAIRRRKSA